MNIQKTKHLTYLTMLSARAIILNIAESVYIGQIFYMVRLGLANIIALMAIRLLGKRDMLIVNCMRVIIGNLLRGMIFGSTFWISCGGVVLSSIVLILLDRTDSSLMFTSVLSAIAHSVGQVIVVMMFYAQPMVVAILPYLLLGSIPTGILTGFIAERVLKHIRPLKITKFD